VSVVLFGRCSVFFRLAFFITASSFGWLDFSSPSRGSVLPLVHSVPIWKFIPFVRYRFTCSSSECAGRRSRPTACSASEGSCWDSVPHSRTRAHLFPASLFSSHAQRLGVSQLVRDFSAAGLVCAWCLPVAANSHPGTIPARNFIQILCAAKLRLLPSIFHRRIVSSFGCLLSFFVRLSPARVDARSSIFSSRFCLDCCRNSSQSYS
jgi:hypothetical protein